MFKIRNQSKWSYDTSEGNAVSVKFVSAESGRLILKSPANAQTTFNYTFAGGSFSVGPSVSLSHSTQESFSTGTIYISSTFAGAELAASDLVGFCVTQEISLGAALGGSITGMLMGISGIVDEGMELAKNTGGLGIGLQLAVDHPAAIDVLVGPIAGWVFGKVKEPLSKSLESHAKALLIMKGLNSGVQLTAGVSCGAGYVSLLSK